VILWHHQNIQLDPLSTIGMFVCYPQPGSIKIHDGKILALESRYKNEFCSGAMRHFYIYLKCNL